MELVDLNKFQRKCQHKNFELIERDSKFGYKCLDCGLRTILADTQNWAYFHFVNCYTNKMKLLKTLRNRTFFLWRMQILKKFDNKCVICDALQLPNCHHLVPERIFPAMRYDVDNGVVLCPSHHKFGKFSAHKNALWFYVKMSELFSQQSMLTLIDRALNSSKNKFIWTIEAYYRKIDELSKLSETKFKT